MKIYKWKPIKNQYGVLIAVRCPCCKYVFSINYTKILQQKRCLICGAEIEGVK